jgi:hypothetical protein
LLESRRRVGDEDDGHGRPNFREERKHLGVEDPVERIPGFNRRLRLISILGGERGGDPAAPLLVRDLARRRGTEERRLERRRCQRTCRQPVLALDRGGAFLGPVPHDAVEVAEERSDPAH